jgi:hypothetical protein
LTVELSGGAGGFLSGSGIFLAAARPGGAAVVWGPKGLGE